MFNALKYASSVPVILLSAIQRKASMYINEKGAIPRTWYMDEIMIFKLWIFFVFMNSMYSFWWDISMDWNLISVTFTTVETDDHKRASLQSSKRNILPTIYIRRQLYFSQSYYYITAIIVDFLLRMTWSFKLSSLVYLRQLESSLFMLQLLEIVRRWMWTIFRMESEGVRRLYQSLPTSTGHEFRMNLLEHKHSGLLSPIEEEDA